MALRCTNHLELGAAEALNGVGLVVVLDTHRHDGLSNVHTGDLALGLAEGTTHTGLEPIGTSARQHLVDTKDVVGVHTHADVESILADVPCEVLVGANASSLKGFTGELLAH